MTVLDLAQSQQHPEIGPKTFHPRLLNFPFDERNEVVTERHLFAHERQVGTYAIDGRLVDCILKHLLEVALGAFPNSIGLLWK